MRYDLRNAAFALALTVVAGGAAWAQTAGAAGGATTSGTSTTGTSTTGTTTSGTTTSGATTGTTLGRTGTPNTTTPSATMPNSNPYTPQSQRLAERHAGARYRRHHVDAAGLPGRCRGLGSTDALQPRARVAQSAADHGGQSAMRAGPDADADRQALLVIHRLCRNRSRRAGLFRLQLASPLSPAARKRNTIMNIRNLLLSSAGALVLIDGTRCSHRAIRIRRIRRRKSARRPSSSTIRRRARPRPMPTAAPPARRSTSSNSRIIRTSSSGIRTTSRRYQAQQEHYLG